MKVIGITGGAGSGKSHVLDILEKELGIPSIDSDSVAKQLYLPGGTVYQEIVSEFSEDICLPDGNIDRKKLAVIVFEDAKKLARLNAIVHPATISEIKQMLDAYRKEGKQFVFVESAIADQVNYKDFCDELWFVYASDETKTERLRETRGYSEEKIRSILSNQSSRDVFFRVCSRIIVNERGFSSKELLRQAKFFLSLYL